MYQVDDLFVSFVIPFIVRAVSRLIEGVKTLLQFHKIFFFLLL